MQRSLPRSHQRVGRVPLRGRAYGKEQSMGSTHNAGARSASEIPQPHRTPLFIEQITDGEMLCIVGGVSAQAPRARVPVSALPIALRQAARPGRVFFAHANLAARTSDEFAIQRIEDEWGTSGPLHFEADQTAATAPEAGSST
jgi:hypothetical protein